MHWYELVNDLNFHAKKVEFSPNANGCQAFNSFHACLRYTQSRGIYEGGLKSFRPNNDTRHFFLIFFLFFYIVSL